MGEADRVGGLVHGVWWRSIGASSESLNRRKGEFGAVLELGQTLVQSKTLSWDIDLHNITLMLLVPIRVETFLFLQVNRCRHPGSFKRGLKGKKICATVNCRAPPTGREDSLREDQGKESKTSEQDLRGNKEALAGSFFFSCERFFLHSKLQTNLMWE